VGDVLSHAMLPGIALAFMVMVALGGDGKALPGLLAGAACLGLAGVGCVLLIRRHTRLKDDAALGIVLSVFFGLGTALLGLVQEMPQGSAAGLSSFIYGKAASIVKSDLWAIAATSAVIVAACALLYKELTIVCFDEAFAGAQGWPVHALDAAMMAIVTGVTVVGLQAVGLILIIAFLIIPPAAARFWTHRLPWMMAGAAAIGGAGGWVGASLSALVPRLPAGAIIVVVVAAAFVLSMLFGPARGVLAKALAQRRLARRVDRQHLLRAVYERVERAPGEVAFARLLAARSWSAARLRRALRRAAGAGLVARSATGVRLTPAGQVEAARTVRTHRLWELYLIRHADIAPSHVDRDADQIEHVLGSDLVAELGAVLDAAAVPPSPHAITGSGR
jgi:manganese/zinc/iron transport system permease protein